MKNLNSTTFYNDQHDNQNKGVITNKKNIFVRKKSYNDSLTNQQNDNNKRDYDRKKSINSDLYYEQQFQKHQSLNTDQDRSIKRDMYYDQRILSVQNDLQVKNGKNMQEISNEVNIQDEICQEISFDDDSTLSESNQTTKQRLRSQLFGRKNSNKYSLLKKNKSSDSLFNHISEDLNKRSLSMLKKRQSQICNVNVLNNTQIQLAKFCQHKITSFYILFKIFMMIVRLQLQKKTSKYIQKVQEQIFSSNISFNDNIQIYDMNIGFQMHNIQKKLIQKQSDIDYYIIQIQEVFNLKNIMKEVKQYDDIYPILEIRRTILLLLKITQYISHLIISNRYFNFFVILMIILNCINLHQNQTETTYIIEISFMLFFSVEIFLRFLANHLTNQLKRQYLDNLYVYFGIIAISMMMRIFLSSKYDLNLTPIFLLRILELTGIKSLQHTIHTFYTCIGSMKHTIFVLILMVYYYSVLGMVLFQGKLKNRCTMINLGISLNENSICGSQFGCGDDLNIKCIKGMVNPRGGISNFDNFLFAFLNVFKILFFSNYAELQNHTYKATNIYMMIYFYMIIVFGNYLYLSLMQASIATKFKEIQQQMSQDEELSKRQFAKYNYQMAKDENIKVQREIVQSNKYWNWQIINSPLKMPIRYLNPIKSSQQKIVQDKPNFSLKYNIKSKLTLIQNFFTLTKDQQEQKLKLKQFYEHQKQNNPFHYYKLLYDVFEMTYKKLFNTQKDSEQQGLKFLKNHLLEKSINYNQKYCSSSQIDVLPHLFDILKQQRQELLIKHYKSKYRYNYDNSIKKFNYYQYMVDDMQKDLSKDIKNQKIHSIQILVEKHQLQTIFKDFDDQPKDTKINKIHQICKFNNKKDVQSSIIFKNIFKTKLKLLHFSISQQMNKDTDSKGIEKDTRDEYFEIIKHDVENEMKSEFIYSGIDVCSSNMGYRLGKHIQYLNLLIDNQDEIEFHLQNKKFQQFKKMIMKITTSNSMHNFNYFIILISTIIIAGNGIINDEWYKYDYNLYITIFFSIQQLGQIYVLGIQKFCKNNLNFFEMIINLISIIQLFLNSFNIGQGNQYYEILNSIIVLRILRALINLPFMITVIDVIKKTYKKYLSIALILLLFLISNAIIAFQNFRNKININLSEAKIRNFSDVSISFLTLFDILSLDSFDTIIYLSQNYVSPILSLTMTLIIVIVGNLIIVNLFIANMLDGFQSKKKHIEIDEKQIMNLIEAKDFQDDYVLVNQNCPNIDDVDLFIDEQFKTQNKKELIKFDFIKRMSHADQLAFLNLQKINQDKKLKKILKSYVFKYFFYSLQTTQILMLTYSTWDLDFFKNTYYLILIGFNMIFSVRCYIQIKCYGFQAYFKKSRFIFDFIIISFFWIGLLIFYIFDRRIYMENAILLKSFIMVQFLMEDQVISQIINAFIQSLKDLKDVILLVLFINFIFAVIGLKLYKNKFSYCDEPFKYLGVSKVQCENMGLKWLNNQNNFDDILNAQLTLMIINTFDSWLKVVRISIDSNNTKDQNKLSSFIFYFLYVVVYCWFFQQLIIGVIFKKNQEIIQKNSNNILSENQLKWISILKNLSTVQSCRKICNNQKKVYIQKLIQSSKFQKLINFALSINIIFEALENQGSTIYFIKLIGYILISVTFLFEFIMKFYLNGFKYFQHARYCIEFLIIFSLTINTFVFINRSQIDSYAQSFLFLLQSLQVIRLFSKFKDVMEIKNIIFFAMPKLIHLLKILFVFFYIYGIYGVFFFKQITQGQIINDLSNFSNLFFAFITLFRVATLEDWSSLAYDTTKTENCIQGKTCGYYFAYFYFISFIAINVFVVLNFFVMILIQEINLFYQSDIKPKSYLKITSRFLQIWDEFIQQNQSFNLDNNSIHLSQTINFLNKLDIHKQIRNKDYHLKSFVKIGQLYKQMEIYWYLLISIKIIILIYIQLISFLNINIFSDENQLIDFRVLLFGILKQKYFSQINKDITIQQLSFMSIYEKAFIKEIYFQTKIKPKKGIDFLFYINKATDQLKQLNEADKLKKEFTVINLKKATPLYPFIMKLIILKTWIKFSQKESIDEEQMYKNYWIRHAYRRKELLKKIEQNQKQNELLMQKEKDDFKNFQRQYE